MPETLSREHLAREVHAAWRDGMRLQCREVAPERMQWDTLSTEDHALDAYIADRVISAALAHAEPAEARLTALQNELWALLGKWAAREEAIRTDPDWGKHPSGIVERNTLFDCRWQLAALLEAQP